MKANFFNIVLYIAFGILTGILWAYLCPIPLIPGSVHFRTFAFVAPVLGYLFGPLAGFLAGYVGTIVWALLSGNFVLLHTPLVDGFTVGLSAALPAFFHLQNGTLELTKLIDENKRGFILKCLGFSVLFGVLMVLVTSISLSLFTGLEYTYCIFWIGIADVAPIALAPFAVVFFAGKINRQKCTANVSKEAQNKILYIGIGAWLVIILALVLFINTGKFRMNPVIEIKADNCYDKTLHVVTDEDYRPYSFYGKNGKYSGHDVELVTLIANKMQMNLDLWLMPWDDGIATVTSGRADVLMTCDYSDTYDGSDKLAKTEPVSADDFIVYSIDHIASPDDLYGKRIAITKNANVLSQLKMLNLVKYCISYSNNRKAMQAVAEGEADCAVMRNTIGTMLLQDDKLKGIEGYISIGKSYMCMGVNDKNGELVNKINAAIEELKTDGELAKLRDKWLTTFVTPYTFVEVIVNNRWIVIMFAFMILLILVVVIRDQRRNLQNMQERKLYLDVVEKLTDDFESVIYIGHYATSPDNVVELRVTDGLKKSIPGWELEPHIEKRFEMMCRTIVAPDDRGKFTAFTQRRNIIRRLDTDKVYFVNFSAVIDGETHEYQIKFSAGLSGSGDLNSCIIGIHSIEGKAHEDILPHLV